MHSKRRSVFLDEEYAFSVTLEELLEYRIAVGMCLSEEQIAAMVEAVEVRRAKMYLVQLLGYRARSESELRSRLQQKQFSESSIDKAVESLRRMGLINDQEFAQAWVRNRLTTGKAGRLRLAQELRARGVDRQVAEGALAEMSEEKELSFALEVGQRRYERLRDEEPEAQRRKLASFLQRRGFSYETVSRVLNRILSPD